MNQEPGRLNRQKHCSFLEVSTSEPIPIGSEPARHDDPAQSMKYPAQAQKKLRHLWTGVHRKPLPVIVAAGCVSLLAYAIFVVLPFFIPNTDRGHFPPYLALPETGFELSNYYLLYAFISLNALAMFGLYLLALRAAGAGMDETAPEAKSAEPARRLIRIVLAFSVLFHLMMFVAPSLLSTDLFDYIRHGRILAVYGENPLVVPATYFPQDPFFSVGGWVATGSVYGSFHVYVMALLSRIAGDGFAANFFLFKGFFIGLDILNLWLIRKIAARIKPGMEMKALLFYGWNPFILTLVVAGAHNDILMLALVLAGFLLYLDRRVRLGALCLALATLVKFIALPILLVYTGMAIRQKSGLVNRLKAGMGTLGIAMVIFFLSYLPLWAGRETFSYLATVGQKTNFTISALVRDAAAGHIQLSLSNTIVQFSLGAMLAAYLVWHIWGARDTNGLLSASAGLAFLTPLALFWFQPWYLTLALGLVALRPRGLMFLASLAFSFSVMFFDSFWWHAPVSMDIQKPLRVMVVFGPPVALLLIVKGRELLPALWKRVLAWALEQTADAGPSAGESLAAREGIVDPSPVRLAVEVSILVGAAALPMVAVISTSSQLRYLVELMFLKIQLLFG